MIDKRGMIMVACMLAAAPRALLAHATISGTDLGAGFLHPLSAFDHAAAIIAVGVLGAWLRGGKLRLVWALLALILLKVGIGHSDPSTAHIAPSYAAGFLLGAASLVAVGAMSGAAIGRLGRALLARRGRGAPTGRKTHSAAEAGPERHG